MAESFSNPVPVGCRWICCVAGMSLAVSAFIDCAVMLSQAQQPYLLCGALALLLMIAWVYWFRPTEILFVDQVAPLMLVCIGILGVLSPFLPQVLMPLVVVFKILVAAAILPLWARRRTLQHESAQASPGHKVLAKPVAYLVAYEVTTCLAFGIVSQTCIPNLVTGGMNAGLGVGVALGGVVAMITHAYADVPKGIDVLTRISLIAIVISWLIFAQPAWMELALALCGMGFGLFAYLVLRLSEDLSLAFDFSGRFMPCVFIIFIMGLAAGHGVGWLIDSSGFMTQNPVIVVVFCVAIVVVVTVYGLSSERIWVASGLGAQEEEQPDKGGKWKGACETVARAYGLTSRETDVLVLLSRGRNAAYIEKELVVSGNTVKSHMLSIYRKLGVHSQQELISLVEQELGQ